MNTPLRTPSSEAALLRIVVDTNRMAAPSQADRERITEALRTRLGVDVLPEGLVPAAGAGASGPGASDPGISASGAGRVASSPLSGLGRGGWLNIVIGTGVVAGALGFALGYGMGQRERPAPLERAAALDHSGALASEARASSAPSLPVHEPAPDTAANGSTLTFAEPASRDPRTREASASAAAPVERAASRRRVANSGVGHTAAVASAAPATSTPRALAFAEVLERLQRANVALREGRVSLALIQLEALDRGGGEVLREEREVTRVLALCALGDVAGARRVAAALRSGAASSIYGPRLDASCAAEPSR